MKRVFVDTNVLLDFLANRVPFAEDAGILFEASERRQLNIFVSAISFNNIYYILHQQLNHAVAIRHIANLFGLVTVVSVDSKIIEAAMGSGFTDFEDAIQYQCTLRVSKIDAILTRNTKDFRRSDIPVFTPREYVSAKQF